MSDRNERRLAKKAAGKELGRRGHTEQAFEDLYARIPDPGCKGLCVDSCSIIRMHPFEELRLATAGVFLPTIDQAMDELAETGEYHCPALVDGRCALYEIRPTICRLYGAVSTLRCDYGCEPASGFLSEAEGQAIMTESKMIGPQTGRA